MKNQTKIALMGVIGTALIASTSFALPVTTTTTTMVKTPVVKTSVMKKKVTTVKKATPVAKKTPAVTTATSLQNKITALDKQIATAQDQKAKISTNAKLSAAVKASRTKVLDAKIAKLEKSKSDLQTKLANLPVQSPMIPAAK